MYKAERQEKRPKDLFIFNKRQPKVEPKIMKHEQF